MAEKQTINQQRNQVIR